MIIKRILYKTKKGIPLSKFEENYLASYLGLHKSKVKILFIVLNVMVVFFLCLMFCGVFKFFERKMYLLFIPCIYLIVIIALMIKIPYKKRIENYLHLLDELYTNKLHEYEKYEIIMTGYIPQLNSYIEKNTVILITDGYNFILLEDLLKGTQYSLPSEYITKHNPNPVLKVVDKSTISKHPISFKLQDIYCYKLMITSGLQPNEEIDYSDVDEHTKVYSKEEFHSYLMVTLKDHSIFKFSPNTYSIFKKALPLKEEK